ncbi:hypothetical protein [Dactylosporangium salmoneum]
MTDNPAPPAGRRPLGAACAAVLPPGGAAHAAITTNQTGTDNGVLQP